MMLWDIIRDFFVRFVFGGIDSNYEYFGGMLGSLTFQWDNDQFNVETFYSSVNEISFPIGPTFENNNGGVAINTFISLGDWLSTTATIITLVGLFIGITMFIMKLVKWISNTIAMR